MRITRFFTLSLSLMLSACASTPDTINPGPVLPSVTDLGGPYNRLHAYVRLKRPESITTLGEAARYYLDTTGYRLQRSRSMEMQSVPPERSRLPVTIETAIVRLIGHGYRWNIDHEAKTVTLEPMPADSPVQNHVMSVTDAVHSHTPTERNGTD
jgi:hypothetical protein